MTAEGSVRSERLGAVAVLLLVAPPLNLLSAAMRGALLAALDAAEADPGARAILLIAEGRSFPAGIDLHELDAPVPSPDLAPDLAELCDRVEACTKPVVAALHGHVLGGGLELALAAHRRIALAECRLGLPQVALGLVPGAGGTQRLPRLIGAEAALRLMLDGAAISAAEALALGLVDQVVAQDLPEAAYLLAESLQGATPQRTGARTEAMRDGKAYAAAVKAARAALGPHPTAAAERIVDCVEAAQLLALPQGLAFERSAHADLLARPEAAALRHAVFAERAVARYPEAGAVAHPLRRIGVAGAALADQALLLLEAGFDVVLMEPQRPLLVQALERIAARQEIAVEQGALAPEARDAAWARLSPALAAAALAECDLVLLADAGLWPEVAEAVPPGVVLALTARAPLPEGLRGADTLGFRFAGGRLAEVVVGAQTAPGAVATAFALARRLGLAGLRVAEPGGVAGRVMLAGRAAAEHLQAQGVAPEALVGALAGFGLPGLAPDGVVPGRVASKEAAQIVNRVLAAMANEGAKLLGLGVVTRPAAIDFALIAAQGFPRHEGGPMFWADRRGLLILRRDLKAWEEEAPAIWGIAPVLASLAAQGARFARLEDQASRMPETTSMSPSAESPSAPMFSTTTR